MMAEAAAGEILLKRALRSSLVQYGTASPLVAVGVAIGRGVTVPDRGEGGGEHHPLHPGVARYLREVGLLK